MTVHKGESVGTQRDRALAVPDANVFLEFEDFANIDWPELLDAKHVTLVITYTVLKELDKRKTDRDRRRDIAISATRRLEALIAGQGGVSLRIGVSVARSDVIVDPATLPAPLEKENADDLILAAVLRIKEEAPDPVVFVTDDTGARLKARVLGVEVLSMPENLRRPAEPSPESRELARLKARLDALEARQPRPLVVFDGPSGPSPEAAFSVRVPRRPTEKDLESHIAPLRTHHDGILAQMRGEAVPSGFSSTIIEAMMSLRIGGRPRPEQISTYEQEVRTYLAEYREYLQKQYEIERVICRTLQLRLLVINGGHAPAERCHLLLHFPDDVDVQRRPLRRLEPPKAPSPPSPLDWLQGIMVRPPDIGGLLRVSHMPLAGSSTPRIRKVNSTEVDYGPEDVMHGGSLAWRLEPVYVVLPEESRPNHVGVPFEIHAANLPEPSKGVLKIALQYVEVEPWSLGSGEDSEEEVEDDDS